MRKYIGIFLISFSLPTIAYYGYSWWEQAHLDKPYQASKLPVRQEIPQHKPQGQPLVYDPKPKLGEEIGDLIIPRLKTRLPVVEGTDDPELAKGIGHYLESAFPGQPDNMVLAGHRDTTLRRAKEIQKGDQLIIQNSKGTFTYKVSRMWVADKADRTVIVHHNKPLLTLITCFPFGYIGEAPQRYIIQADLIDSKLNQGS